jgi:hypothetical protein
VWANYYQITRRYIKEENTIRKKIVCRGNAFYDLSYYSKKNITTACNKGELYCV